MAKIKDLLPEQHMLIGGGTGSGKSFTASELHDEANKSIYFNFPQKEADEYEITGIHLERAEGKYISKILNGRMEGVNSKKIAYEAHWRDDKADQELRGVYEEAKKANGHVYLFVDEAHRFGDALTYALRDGRGHKVHVIPITQRPKDLDTSAISQIQELMIYRLAQQQRVWFKQMYMPFEKIKSHTDQDFHFVIYDNTKGDFTKYPPIPFNP